MTESSQRCQKCLKWISLPVLEALSFKLIWRCLFSLENFRESFSLQCICVPIEILQKYFMQYVYPNITV